MTGPGGVPSLRELKARAKRVGIETWINAGEVYFRHPEWDRTVKVNLRRKDGTPELNKMVTVLEGRR